LGIVAVVALASSWTSPWYCCQCYHCGAGVTVVVTMAPLPTLFGRHQRCGAGVSSLLRRRYCLGGIALATWTSVPFVGGGASGGLRIHFKLPWSLAWYPLYPPGHVMPEPPVSSSLVLRSSLHSSFVAPSPSFGLLRLGGLSGQHLGWVSGAMPAAPNSVTAAWARPHH
jgi:hypothetical protein